MSMFRNLNWSEREAHMFVNHGVTTSQAEEALADPERLVINPDYNSDSGRSVRIIGYCPSRHEVLTVIAVVDDDTEYGANGWPANGKDQSIYYRKGENDEQDF